MQHKHGKTNNSNQFSNPQKALILDEMLISLLNKNISRSNIMYNYNLLFFLNLKIWALLSYRPKIWLIDLLSSVFFYPILHMAIAVLTP